MQLSIGYTCEAKGSDLLADISRDVFRPQNSWYFKFSCRDGVLASSLVAYLPRVRPRATTHRCSEGTDVAGANVVDLCFSPRELACYWNGNLASLCQLPDTQSFPAHARNLRWFCILEATSTFDERGATILGDYAGAYTVEESSGFAHHEHALACGDRQPICGSFGAASNSWRTALGR